MDPICLACKAAPSVTVDDYTPLCRACMDRQGENIVPGARVVLEFDPNGSYTGVVDRLENDGYLAVVNTHDGGEAWLPVVELVRVVAGEVVTVVD